MADSQAVKFGAGNDLQIYHDGSNSGIDNQTGDLYIRQYADDKNITFQSDNGSGGIATYFEVNGAVGFTINYKMQNFQDDVFATFGNGSDLSIYHNGTTNNSNIDNATGDLYFTQNTDDGDIIFRNDNGSGGVTEYLRLDGGITSLVASKDLLMAVDGNGGKIKFGASQDLEIYHDGSNSYIKDSGTGDLRIWGDNVNIGTASGNKVFFSNSGVAELYYTGGAKKLETTSTGIEVSGGVDVTGGTTIFNNVSQDKKCAFRRTSANNYSIEHSATRIYFYNETSGVAPLDIYNDSTIKLNGYSSGVTGTEAYNLAIDSSGKIITTSSSGGGGGGGTAKGGHFSKLYTTGAIGANGIAFTITRATGAAMIFDVMFTGGGTGSGSSTCKKYTVAKKYGTAIGSIYYNKIIDTGPALGGSGTADYNIVFDVSGSSGDAIECNITPVGVANQEIGITIDLGFGAQNAVVVMN